MGILLGLIPALSWGMQAIVMQKIGGKFTNKVMGMTITTALVAVVVFLFHRPVFTWQLIVGSIICGASWSFAQILQVKSFDMLPVSMAMPISTGEQLVGTALVGATILGEWRFGWQWTLGIIALIVLIGGICMTAYHEKQGSTDGASVRKGIVMLTVSAVGYVLYATVPQLFHLNGWDVLLPQGLAMVITMAIMVAFQPHNEMWGKKTWQNMLTGVCFAVGNLTILFSNHINGVAVGYTLSQLNVVVSTIGGLLLLHEVKTKKELKFTLGGLLLVVAGAVMIGITKF